MQEAAERSTSPPAALLQSDSVTSVCVLRTIDAARHTICSRYHTIGSSLIWNLPLIHQPVKAGSLLRDYR